MSTLIFINHQLSSCTSDTLNSKHLFEEFAASSGVSVSSYRADNYIFNADLYLQDCKDLGQTIGFYGVGAYHQNAAERDIPQTMSWTRILVIDAVIHWPDAVDLDLWPMAMNHAVYV